MKMRLTTVVCLLIMSASALGAQSGDRAVDAWTSRLDRAMAAQVEEWAELGVVLTEPEPGIETTAKLLRGDEPSTEEFELEGDKTYLILGICQPTGCPDIDLYAYDENDESLGGDTEPDPLPVVEVNLAGRTERTTISVTLVMVECEEKSGCWSKIGAYVLESE